MNIIFVEGMSCEHCVKRIEACLAGINIKCLIDLAAKEVRFDGNSKQIETVVTALAEIGYSSQII